MMAVSRPGYQERGEEKRVECPKETDHDRLCKLPERSRGVNIEVPKIKPGTTQDQRHAARSDLRGKGEMGIVIKSPI
jgi:hypothetical protein